MVVSVHIMYTTRHSDALYHHILSHTFYRVFLKIRDCESRRSKALPNVSDDTAFLRRVAYRCLTGKLLSGREKCGSVVVYCST